MNKKYIAYVGSYTHECSKGIHIYDMDVEKGRISERAEVAIDNPSFIAFSHDGNFLYSICDQGVSSFAVLENGDLELMNVQSINGMRGCHITVTKDNKFLIVSGYHDGKITVLHINQDGSIGVIADEVFHKGIGSVAERNFRPHVSETCFTPDEELLCACDLGIDQIKLYEFNHVTGKLKLYDIIRSQQESAPRKMIFSKDGRFAYVVCELKNYINVYSYNKDSEKERFELVQNIFTVRRNHKSNSAATDILFTESGDNLLCTNAGDNTVTIYSVNKETGCIAPLNSLPVSGDYPKYGCLFPDDKHFLSMNNEGNSITIFTVNYERGLIVMNGHEIKISKPNNMIIKQV
ncbi:MAG: beta-propeller fold lactonase family protein [Eubacteriales bacterium]|nr:beta-propeller fold lactonase family protein [Eubacteriales bacterium]